MLDDSHADASRATAAENVYDRLTLEISQSVIDRLEAGDDVVVSRLGTFLLCLSGKSGMQANTHNVQKMQKMVRFPADGSDEAESGEVGESSAAIADDDDDDDKHLIAKNEQTTSLLSGDDRSRLWRMMCESCRLSLRLVYSQSSRRHLRFLSVVLSCNFADPLLADLLNQPELLSASELSSCRDFLERILLPLVDKFHDSEGSRHMLSLLTSVYGRLQPVEQVPVLKEVADRASWSVVCADFLSEVVKVTSAKPSEQVECWLRGSEFGQFVVSLIESICHRRQRQLTESRGDEVEDKSVQNDRSVDDSHWKLLCACITINHKSGQSCLTYLQRCSDFLRTTLVWCVYLCA